MRRLAAVLLLILLSAPFVPPATPAMADQTMTATTALNLRTGPSTADAVILVMPAGATVTDHGAAGGGFDAVTYQGTDGYAYAAYLSGAGAGQPAPPPSGGGGNATTTTDLNLRSGPGTNYSVLTVIPAGASVTDNGSAGNGFDAVIYRGTSGYAYAAYLSAGGGQPQPQPAPSPAPPPPSGNGTPMTTTTDLNLRAGPGTGYAVILVMPSGAAVTDNGAAGNGYDAVVYQGTSGYAYAAYLTAGSAPGPAPSPAPSPPSGGNQGQQMADLALQEVFPAQWDPKLGIHVT